MCFEDTKMLEFNQYLKSEKMHYIIYADLEFLIKRIDGCKNNLEKPSTTEIGEHTPCEYAMSMIWAFDGIENRRHVYRGEDCMKKFCVSLRERAMEIINFEKEKMMPLKKEQ